MPVAAVWTVVVSKQHFAPQQYAQIFGLCKLSHTRIMAKEWHLNEYARQWFMQAIK